MTSLHAEFEALRVEMVRLVEAAERKEAVYGAHFSAEIYTRGCHWFPRLLASSEQACDQWHSSRLSTFLTGWHCKFRPNTKGTVLSF
jgi:hypothetical protein